MLKLIGLELRQNRLKSYILGTLIISVSLLAFAYLFAFLPHLPTDSELEEKVMELVGNLFGNYENIIGLTCTISMFCFAVMSAVMQSKIVVADYTGKRANLLFSYPVERDRLLFAKVILVTLFTVTAMFVCNALVFGIFFFMESQYPLISGSELTGTVVGNTVKITVLLSILAAATGMISLWFGFCKKSVTSTLIASYILSILFSNIFGSSMLIGNTLEQSPFQIIIVILSFVVGAAFITQMMHGVKRMEAV